jgi:tetratricopeptide (TPR) repeat protein
MWVQKLREYLADLVDNIKNVLNNLRLRWLNMYSHNMGQAVDYFDLGMLDECYTRLRIILKIWPKNEYAMYLLGLVYVCGGEMEEALEYLSQIIGSDQERAQRLIRIVETGKGELLSKKYIENPDLDVIENEIKKILP